MLFATLLSCDGQSRRKQPIAPPTPASAPAPAPSPAPIVQNVKPVVNVYIENSGSMDGYVKGATEFENAVYNYLSDILISDVSDSLNLFYINSKIIEYGSDIQDFIEKLEPTTFKQRGGNRGTSDIANVIDAVLSETQSNEIAILVTDGIFSPGQGKDATEYLENQKIGIKRRMANYLEKYSNTAVIVYQLSSKFDGTYFYQDKKNKTEKGMHFTGQRPFYVYVIGNAQLLTQLREKVPDAKFKGSGVQHVFLAISSNQQVKYAVNPSIGKYKKSKNDTKNTIKDLEKDDRTGKVKFAVNVDFSKLLLDESYLNNVNNYENSSKYEMEIKPSVTKNGYTHTLTFTSDKVHKGEVSVKLKAKLPDWVEQVNDYDGTAAVPGKTYGI
jgi:hypothetical protein